jgi:hypothetical protein
VIISETLRVSTDANSLFASQKPRYLIGYNYERLFAACYIKPESEFSALTFSGPVIERSNDH